MSTFSTNVRHFPGFDHFFVLRENHYQSAFRGNADIGLLDPFALKRGDAQPQAPVSVTHAMGGSHAKDFVWTTYAVLNLVSERVVRLFKESNFTGWGTYPVHVFGKDGDTIPGYAGLQVSGRCGPLIPERSGRIMKQMPGGKFEYRVGWYFDELTWDGSDFFVAENYGATFVHERVKICLEEARVKNVRFVRLDQEEWKDIGQFSPSP